MATGDQTGLFTEAQRAYLLGEKTEISSGYENSLRSKIRNQINGGLSDIALLDNLDSHERELLYESNIKRTPNGAIAERPNKDEFLTEGKIGLRRACVEFIKFYHKTRRENGVPKESICADIAFALESAEQDHHNHRHEVDATIEIETTREIDLDDAMARFENEGVKAISSVELKALAEEGYITLQGD
jgi:hypothetical protein